MAQDPEDHQERNQQSDTSSDNDTQDPYREYSSVPYEGPASFTPSTPQTPQLPPASAEPSESQTPLAASSGPLSYDSPAFYNLPQNQGVVQEQPAPDVPYPSSPLSYNSPSGYAPPPTYPYNAQLLYGYEAARGFETPVPQASPLPLGEAIRQLPRQYFKIVTRPSTRAFTEEMGKAKWNIVWVQLIFYTLFVTAISYIPIIGHPLDVTPPSSSTFDPASYERIIQVIIFLSTTGQLVFVPVFVLATVGILFLLAKAFGGQGKFLTQLYTTMLFIVPLGIIVQILALLTAFTPFGAFCTFLLGFARIAYEGVLLGMALIPVHRISAGRAAGAVIIFYGIALILFCLLGIILAAITVAIARPS